MFKKKKKFNILKYNIKYIDFLKIQIDSFKRFLNINSINKTHEGLYILLKNFFYIYNKKKKIKLKFVKYYISLPRYNIEESIERNITYSINITIKLKIIFQTQQIEKKFFLCTCPYITNNG
ncbi:MAG: hypothetical protein NHF85_00345, partial [Candidatus Shikimatogenerans sp. JK-2022]|nr:hypothetical protein [Candidatus Shikimatogenerans bostrichidophilus]